SHLSLRPTPPRPTLFPYTTLFRSDDTDNSYMETKTYKNLPAVKEGRAFVADAKSFQFNDPDTLDYQLEFFQEKFLGKCCILRMHLLRYEIVRSSLNRYALARSGFSVTDLAIFSAYPLRSYKIHLTLSSVHH